MNNPPGLSSLVIDNSTQIMQIADSLNHQTKLFNILTASSFTATDSYIKWFSPSLDYPCLPSAYYIFAPFKIEWKNHSGLLVPCLFSSQEQGEREDILNIVKDAITRIIIRLPRT